MDEPHRVGWIPATSRKANTPKELKMASRCSQDELPVFATAVGTPSSLTSRAHTDARVYLRPLCKPLRPGWLRRIDPESDGPLGV